MANPNILQDINEDASLVPIEEFLPPPPSASVTGQTENDKAERDKQYQENLTISKPKLELSVSQMEDIKTAFNAFDDSGRGFMSKDDLKVALRALGTGPKNNELTELLIRIGAGKKAEKICFSEFLSIIQIKLYERESKESIIRAFRLFDLNKLGRITADNLHTITTELGEEMNEEEILEMINGADKDRRGGVDFEEFYQLMMKTPLN